MQTDLIMRRRRADYHQGQSFVLTKGRIHWCSLASLAAMAIFLQKRGESIHLVRHIIMIPMPNVIAGILIGVANSSWVEVLVSSLVWPGIYCLYVSLTERPRIDATVAQFKERGKRLLLGSPVATFYAIEFATALLTALPIACIAFLIKRVFS